MLLLLGGFLLLMLLGLPVALSMAVSSLVYILVTGITPDVTLAQRMIAGVESFPLLAVPFFILAGNLMNIAGVTGRIYKFAVALVGWMRGRCEMMAQHFAQRKTCNRFMTGSLSKFGRLGEFQANPEAENHQYGAGKKGQAPSPAHELGVGQRIAEKKEEAIGEDEADRRTELGEHAETRAPAGRRILHGEQRGTAPFSAKAEPLTEAHQAQQQRRPPAKCLICRQKSDGEGRAAHQEQRGHQRRLAPDPVTIMPEHRRAQRPRKKGDRKTRISRKQLCRRRGRRKEKRPEYQRRRRRIDVEIIEFDRGAREAGGEYPLVSPHGAQAALLGRLRHDFGRYRAHPDFPRN